MQQVREQVSVKYPLRSEINFNDAARYESSTADSRKTENGPLC